MITHFRFELMLHCQYFKRYDLGRNLANLTLISVGIKVTYNYGKGFSQGPYIKKCRVIRYQVTATRHRPQIKQFTASNEGEGVQNQLEHRIILTMYEAVHPTDVSENYPLLGIRMILIKVQT